MVAGGEAGGAGVGLAGGCNKKSDSNSNSNSSTRNSKEVSVLAARQTWWALKGLYVCI